MQEAVGQPVDDGFGVAGFLGAAGENLEFELRILGADDEGEACAAFLGALELLADFGVPHREVGGNARAAESSDEAKGDGVSESTVATRIFRLRMSPRVEISAGMSKKSRRHSRYVSSSTGNDP